jgi:hypothetical protein
MVRADGDGPPSCADAGVDDGDMDGVSGEVAVGGAERVGAIADVFGGGTSWVMLTTFASGAMLAMTPFMEPTKPSARTKSVVRVMMGRAMPSVRRGLPLQPSRRRW